MPTPVLVRHRVALGLFTRGSYTEDGSRALCVALNEPEDREDRGDVYIILEGAQARKTWNRSYGETLTEEWRQGRRG